MAFEHTDASLVSKPGEKQTLFRRLAKLIPRKLTSSNSALKELASRSRDLIVEPKLEDESERLKVDFLAEINKRSKIIHETGICPILSHFSPTENLLSMIEKSNDPEFGADAFRIRIANINNQLGIKPTAGWGADRGRVSYYVSGMDRRIAKKDSQLIIEQHEYEDNKAAGMNNEGKTVLYITPWFSTMGEDFNGYSMGASGELQLDLDSTGTRKELIKRGASLLHPLTQVFVPKIHEEQFRSAIESIQDNDLREHVQKQISFVTPDEANVIQAKIKSNGYTRELFEKTAIRNNIPVEQIYDQAAIYSMINPRKLTDRMIEEMHFHTDQFKKRAVAELIYYATGFAQDELLSVMLKQVARQDIQNNNPLAIKEQIVQSLWEKAQDYIQ